MGSAQEIGLSPSSPSKFHKAHIDRPLKEVGGVELVLGRVPRFMSVVYGRGRNGSLGKTQLRLEPHVGDIDQSTSRISDRKTAMLLQVRS